MSKISIVIPCYNEEKNIKKLVEEFKLNLINKEYDIEVVLVNNGSQDNSAEIMKELQTKNDFIKIETVKENKGYGYGILRGLKVASGDFLGWIHADLQCSPKEISKAIEYLKQKNFQKDIFIKGKRSNRPIVDRIFTFGMSIYETLILRTVLWDINAQPTIFSRDFMEKLENPPFDFSLDLYMYYMAKKMNMRIYRYKVVQHKRQEGESSWNNGMKARIKLIKRVMKYSKKLKNSKLNNDNKDNTIKMEVAKLK